MVLVLAGRSSKIIYVCRSKAKERREAVAEPGVLKPLYHLGFHGSPPSSTYKFCGGRRRKEKVLRRKKNE